MAKQLTEVLSGLGVIHAGDQLLRKTNYRLEVFSEEGAPNAEPAIIIDGSIDITGLEEALVLAGPGVLSLQIEDGRRVAFKLTNTTGRIQVHGGLESPSAG